MLGQGLTSCCWVLLKAATDAKALSVAVEKTAGTIAAVENAWLSSVGDACSSHLKQIMEGRACHHQKVAAQHAGLMPNGTRGRCQGVQRGGRGEKGDCRVGLGGEETEKTENLHLDMDSKSFIVMGWCMGLL